MNKKLYIEYFGIKVYYVLNDEGKVIGFTFGDDGKIYDTASDCFAKIHKIGEINE